MVSRQAKRRKPENKTPVVEEKKPPKVYEKGASVMEILLVAPTCAEAEDFLCGCYFNLNKAVSGSSLTAYTREFPTINRLTETKHLMEETILKPVGREIVRAAAEDELPLEQCNITVSQAGNTALSLDLHFTWAAPGTAAGHQADVVFALLNCAEAQSAAASINAARNAAAGSPVIWILSNFEKKNVFWAIDGTTAPRAQLRRELQELLGLSCGNGEYAVYAQLYGGLEFIGRNGGNAVLRTDRRCREYMPVACHVPVFMAVEAVRRYRAGQQESAAPDATQEKIYLLMQEHKDTLKGWYDTHGEKGEG